MSAQVDTTSHVKPTLCLDYPPRSVQLPVSESAPGLLRERHPELLEAALATRLGVRHPVVARGT